MSQRTSGQWVAILCSLLVTCVAHGAYNGILERADEQFALRDYSGPGLKSAQDARYNYEKVVTKFIDDLEGQYAAARYLQANYFIGEAETNDKASTFMDGFAAGKRALIWFDRTYGRTPFRNASLGDRGRKIFADLIAFHAFNTLGWIRESGGGYAAEWREVERLLTATIEAGLGHISDFAPHRVLADRALIQGDSATALKHFEIAVRGTEVAGTPGVSRLGSVNYGYAVTLNKGGKQTAAVQLLRTFLGLTPDRLAWGYRVENRHFRDRANELLKSWGEHPRPSRLMNEFVIKIRREISPLSALALKTLLQQLGKVESLSEHYLLLKLPMDQVFDSAEVVRALAHRPQIQLVEPNFLYYPHREVNDPRITESWALDNRGQLDSRGVKGIAGVDIRAKQAWDHSNSIPGITVAVIDTGVDFSHPELASSAWVNQAEAQGQSKVDDDGNGYVDDINGYDFLNNRPTPLDDNGHGTHVAGIIAAQGDNAVGTAGVAWQTKIMALKFLGGYGGGSLAGAVQAIQYATKMGARITNNSWGGGEYSEILRDAIKEAGLKGSLFVVASGNSGEDLDARPEYPVSYQLPNMLSVASIDNRGRLSNFSNYGARSVDVAAPGQNILSSTPGGNYESWSGTSMAAPFVAGAAALVTGQNPALTPIEIKDRIKRTSSPLLALRNKISSGGTLNLLNTVLNQASPEDPNDPGRWEGQPSTIATPHPYRAQTDQIWEIQIPGAKMVAVRFSQFEVERGYDRLIFSDANNNLIGMWTDRPGQAWSPTAEGDTLRLRLITDGSIEAAGFTIDQVGVKR